jgi:hypothetical protein
MSIAYCNSPDNVCSLRVYDEEHGSRVPVSEKANRLG